MNINVVKTAAEFENMSAKELLAEWPRYFDDPPKSRSNKSYLMGELIYRIQELSFGGLTKQTIDRLEALAENKSLKERKGDISRLAIGTRLVREVKGVEHHVTVLEEGYEYQGVKYKSLSGVAYAITGTRWNGNVFFGLGKKENPRPYRRSRKMGGGK
ncbi:MAG: DUF2924 domain-containing protein [Alphaproteobacteria bacterium]|nr:DUF2924 domain-containing protein [Alphaproteobacteria bacterium]